MLDSKFWSICCSSILFEYIIILVGIYLSLIFFCFVMILNFCINEDNILLIGNLVFWGVSMLVFNFVILSSIESKFWVLFKEFIMFLDSVVSLLFCVFLLSMLVNNVVVLKGCMRLCLVVVRNLVLFLLVLLVCCLVFFNFVVCCVIFVFKFFFVFFNFFWIVMYLVILL